MANYTLTIKFTPDLKVKTNSSSIPSSPLDKTCSNVVSIQYNSNNTSNKAYTRIESSDKNTLGAVISLTDILLKKQVYKPGYLNLKLELSSCTTEEGVSKVADKLKAFFKGAKLCLTKAEDEIATNYCVISYKLKEKTKDNVTNFFVEIDAYSPDYYLKRDKYSKVFTGKKFFDDIIQPSISENSFQTSFWPRPIINEINFNNDKDKAGDTQQIEVQKPYHIRMNFDRLRYTTTNGGEYEFIQPYLVQYDESAYDFLIRVLNRCGEYFYFEKGTFVFGWIEPHLLDRCLKEDKHDVREEETDAETVKDEDGKAVQENGKNKLQIDPTRGTTKFSRYGKSIYMQDLQDASIATTSSGAANPSYNKIDISKFNSIEGRSYLDDEKDVQAVSYDYTDTGDLNTEGVNLKDSSSDRYNDTTISSDENLAGLLPKDKYIDSADEFPWDELFPAFMDCLNEESIGDMISTLTWTEGVGLIAQGEVFLAPQQAYKEKIYDVGAYYNERIDHVYSANEESQEVKEGDEIDTNNTANVLRPFSTGQLFAGYDTKLIFDKDFYEDNAEGIQKTEQGRIKLELETQEYSLYLGSIIKVNGKEYIVVAIEDSCTNTVYKTTEAQDDGSKKVTIHEGKKQIFNIEALPYQEGGINYPPMINNNVFYKKSKGPQRAFVAFNIDPLRMNRVRIRYTWQKKGDDLSPWIRMTVPMAGNERGFNFIPDIGDEAIINYENDNIEKPYIVGMVYNSNNKTDSGFSFKNSGVRSITSGNGHSIIFSDPSNGVDAIKAYAPGWNFISKLIPFKYCGAPGKIDDEDANDTFRTATGGIELADKIGFYSIAMSTNRRAISIDSPFGKVEISAFTGIDISAPNGDINIEAKNINISARNNVSIVSGNSIDPYFGDEDTRKENIIESFRTLGISLLKRLNPIDMALVRTIFEAFFRPVGGKLLLKSNYNLCMEAGDTSVDEVGEDDGYLSVQKIYTNLQQLKIVYDTCANLNPDVSANNQTTNLIESTKGNFTATFDAFSDEKKNELKNELGQLKDGRYIDIDKYDSSIQTGLTSINELPIYFIYKTFSNEEAFKKAIKSQINKLNINIEVSNYILGKLTDFINCFDKNDVDTPEQWKFPGNKCSYFTNATDNNIKENKKEFFYQFFLNFYHKYVHVSQNNTQPGGSSNALNASNTPPDPNELGDLESSYINSSISSSSSTTDKWAYCISKITTKTHVATWQEKARSTLKTCWGYANFDTEITRKRRHKGKILYSSGDNAETYVIRNGRLERFTSSSKNSYNDIRELLSGI